MGYSSDIRLTALDKYAFCTYNQDVNYQWDPHKAAANIKKHGVEFADAVGVFEDETALWQEDIGDHDEERFVALGTDFVGRILVIVFTFRDENIRIISARKATESERKTYESQQY